MSKERVIILQRFLSIISVDTLIMDFGLSRAILKDLRMSNKDITLLSGVVSTNPQLIRTHLFYAKAVDKKSLTEELAKNSYFSYEAIYSLVEDLYLALNNAECQIITHTNCQKLSRITHGSDAILEKARQGDVEAQIMVAGWYEEGSHGLPQSYDDARNWYLKAASSDDPRAVFKMGYYYKNGLGVDKSEVFALAWFQKASRLGYVEADKELSSMNNDSSEIVKQTKNELEIESSSDCIIDPLLIEEAQKNNPNAIHSLGMYYLNGIGGFPKSTEKAIKWLTKAASFGNGASMDQLGLIYHQGNGIEKSIDLAMDWYKKSAIAGYAHAYYHLGEMYYYGDGVLKKNYEALNYLEKGASMGDSDCMYLLGRMRLYGEGVMQSEVLAIDYFQDAAKLGNKNAIMDLAELYYNNKDLYKDDPSVAFPIFEEAAILGSPAAQFKISKLYQKGTELTPKSETESIKWLEKSASNGFADALYEKAICYEKGVRGYNKSHRESIKLLKEASKRGSKKAQNALSNNTILFPFINMRRM